MAGVQCGRSLFHLPVKFCPDRHGGSFLAIVRELEGSQHVSQIDLQQDLSCVSVPGGGVETDEDGVHVSARRTYQGFEGLGHGSGRRKG